MVTPKQRQLVQMSFAKIVPISEVAAQLFYARLFALDPSLRPLFRGDVKEQGRKLMNMIGQVVNDLDDFDRIVPAIQDLGRRHTGYGVEGQHYDAVGVALLWTVEQCLGTGYTAEIGEAWGSVYTLLANIMKEAAYGGRRVRLVGT